MQIADVRFEGTLPVAFVALTVTTADTGMGTVTGTGSYPVGTAVTLGATPNAGFVFVGWSPDSCKTGMTLTVDTTCTATFTLAETPKPATPSTTPLPEYLGLILQVDGSGSGKVTTDTGLSCQSSDCQVDLQTGELKCNPQACTQTVKTASNVTLTPHADADSVFSSWGGNQNCADGNLFMNSSYYCIAYFHRLYPLTLTLQGQGVVVGYGRDQQPMGIDCGTLCQADYESGTTVYLQASPATGLNFLGWGGDCENMPNPVALKMTQEMICEARFGMPEAPPVAMVTEPPVPVTPVTPATPEVPVMSEPSSEVPVTSEPVPEVPVTSETTSEVPVTSEPTSEVPVTSEPTPVVPVTSEPASAVPVTGEEPVTPPVGKTPPTITSIDTTTEVAPIVTVTETPVTPTVTPPVASPTPVMTSPPVVVSANFACPTTGHIGEVCNYGGREVTNLNVQGIGIVSNGVVSTTVVNVGWVSNFTITAKGKLSGGVVTGYIKNFGVMLDFEFRGASLIGGTLGGTIRNTSKIDGGFQDVTLLANPKITGGILKGTIKGDKKAPAVLEKVRVKQGSKLSGVKIGKDVKLEKGVVVE